MVSPLVSAGGQTHRPEAFTLCGAIHGRSESYHIPSVTHQVGGKLSGDALPFCANSTAEVMVSVIAVEAVPVAAGSGQEAASASVAIRAATHPEISRVAVDSGQGSGPVAAAPAAAALANLAAAEVVVAAAAAA